MGGKQMWMWMWMWMRISSAETVCNRDINRCWSSQRHYLYVVDGFYAEVWWIRRLCWRDLGSAGATSFFMMAFAGWQQTVPAM
ncbi:hypothetical protein FOVSG1_004758 [Fusarium oxysporum f. sp. vasinfectum]